MATDAGWPELPVAAWQPTRDTFTLWLQVVGKVRIARSPLLNHWWNAPLYLTARGLTTSLVPAGPGRSFAIDLDLLDHRLDLTTTRGEARSMALAPRTVSDFHAELMRLLGSLDLDTEIWPVPVELPGAVPFPDDDLHRSYDPAAITSYWGALDLATTRFSGRTAPPHPGGAPNCGPHVMLEAYSHEVSSCGYWPGGEGEGIFYSYAYPEPDGYRARPAGPGSARFDDGLGEFVLPYTAVRTAEDPDAVLLEFLQRTYEAAAVAGGWDRARLERS